MYLTITGSGTRDEKKANLVHLLKVAKGVEPFSDNTAQAGRPLPEAVGHCLPAPLPPSHQELYFAVDFNPF